VNKKKAYDGSSGASIDRYPPIGVFDFSVSYRAAAGPSAKQAFQATRFRDPISFLYCHAIELYLKAFLCLQKVSMSKLRGIGYDFITLLVRSRHKGLVIESKTNEIVELLTESSARGSARYLEVGAVPGIEERGRGCQRFHKAVGEALAAAELPVREPGESPDLKNLIERQPSSRAIRNRSPVGGRFEADRT
jgi:hypothetical protein